MGLRRILAGFVGALQAAIGVLAVIFAYVLYHNFFDVQSLMNISENVPVYMLLLFVFGFVSIISGLFLIHERLEL
ncbi:MAG: hypothetical protein O2V44_08550 [Candidatus Bathyarchaeota archaeon]|nr:hypothetical protein [Candidatus Bathyarchaeota archaeon]